MSRSSQLLPADLTTERASRYVSYAFRIGLRCTSGKNVQDNRFQIGVFITGLVTFVAFHCHIRVCNFWVDAYRYKSIKSTPFWTGVPLNHARRYIHWMLTVLLLLTEIRLVMKLTVTNFTDAIHGRKSWSIRSSSTLTWSSLEVSIHLHSVVLVLCL